MPSGSRFRSLLYSMAFLLSLRKAKMASVHPPPFRNPICALLNKDRMNLIEKLHIWLRIPLACGIRYPRD